MRAVFDRRLNDIKSVAVLVWGCTAGALFYAGVVVQRRRGWVPGEPGPAWLYGVYTVVWLFGIAAAVYALLGEGGFKVAALTVVPLVLLAPTALQGIRMALTAHRPNRSDAPGSPGSTD